MPAGACLGGGSKFQQGMSARLCQSGRYSCAGCSSGASQSRPRSVSSVQRELISILASGLDSTGSRLKQGLSQALLEDGVMQIL